MRANLKAGKLHPEPRTIEHARRRVQQLDHEIEAIRKAHNHQGKTTPIELDLCREWNLLIEWMKTKEAMTMTTKKTTEPELSKQEMHVVICALRVAADAYDADEKTFRQAVVDIGDGKNIPMFASGVDGCRAAKRLADQFFRNAQDVRKVLAKLEDSDEDGDGTVTR